MRRRLLIAITLVLATARARGGTLEALEAEQEALFDRVAPGVVAITAGGALASGFVVSPGLVLTAAHGVAGGGGLSVALRDGRVVRGTVVAVAPEGLDLALVRIAAGPPALPLGSAAALRAGSVVAAVGHSDGSRWMLATGHVAQDPADGADRALLRLQLPLRAGASGGPVVDRAGRVVGVVVTGEGGTSAAFAVRIEAALRAFPEIAAGAPARPAAGLRARAE